MTELRKETERIVERVTAGETIDITRWGKPIATLKSVSPGAEELQMRIQEAGDRWTWDEDPPDAREQP